MSGERFTQAPSRNSFLATVKMLPDKWRVPMQRLLEALTFKAEMYKFTGYYGLLSGAAAAPTTADLPLSGDWCYWTNTGDGKIYHAVNVAATIYTVEMT